MFAKVPAKEGLPLIGNRYLHEGISISNLEAIVYFEGSLEEGWEPLTEDEYNTIKESLLNLNIAPSE